MIKIEYADGAPGEIASDTLLAADVRSGDTVNEVPLDKTSSWTRQEANRNRFGAHGFGWIALYCNGEGDVPVPLMHADYFRGRTAMIKCADGWRRVTVESHDEESARLRAELVDLKAKLSAPAFVAWRSLSALGQQSSTEHLRRGVAMMHKDTAAEREVGAAALEALDELLKW